MESMDFQTGLHQLVHGFPMRSPRATFSITSVNE